MTEEKATGLFMLALNGILTVYAMYGQDIFASRVKEEILQAAKKYHHDLSSIESNREHK